MADVVFFGIGATGFSDPSVQILEGARRSQAEVQFEGLVATAPRAGLATEAVLLSPSQTPRAEFTQVELFTSPIREGRIDNPNENDILLIVSGLFSQSQFNVELVPAPIPRADGTIEQPPPVADDLTLFAGIHAPNGLAGKTIVFLTPTGGGPLQGKAPITGATGLIQTINDSLGLNTITLVNPLPVSPTIGDRAVILSTDRALRRSPVIEVILE